MKHMLESDRSSNSEYDSENSQEIPGVREPESDSDEEPQGLGFKLDKTADKLNETISVTRPSGLGFGKSQSSFAGINAPKIDKDFASFEKYTKGIGSKILYKQGYRPGQGLGKDGAGISAPIKVKQRPSGAGIGAGGFKEKVESSDEEKKDKKGKSSGSENIRWKKSSRRLVNYKTSLQLLTDIEESPLVTNLAEPVKIIDMTGPEVREISSVSESQFKPISRKCQELTYNLQLIADHAKQTLSTTANKRKLQQQRLSKTKSEFKETSESLESEKNRLARLEHFKLILENCQEICNQTLTGNFDWKEFSGQFEQNFGDSIRQLYSEYPEECREFNMEAYFTSIMSRILRNCIRDWNPMQSPNVPHDLIISWKAMLKVEYVLGNETMSPFEAMINLNWLPKVRQCLNNDWNPHDPDPVVGFVDMYKECIPRWMFSNLVHQVILPKLVKGIDDWTFKTLGPKMHSFVFPWLPVLESEIEDLYPECRRKIHHWYQKWIPSERYGVQLFEIWSEVLPTSETDKLLNTSILPRLVIYLRNNFEINPANQNVEGLLDIFAWHKYFSVDIYSHFLETEFFKQWLDILWTWIKSSKSDLKEITQWYTSWKDFFEQNGVKDKVVKECFKTGLDMMNQGITAHRPSQFIPSKAPEPGAMVPNQDQDDITFKDYVSLLCSEKSIEFLPLNRVNEKGMSLYRLGKLTVYLDDGVVWAKINGAWQFRSVQDAIAESSE
jgi:tuftelin-interacting protein 11